MFCNYRLKPPNFYDCPVFGQINIFFIFAKKGQGLQIIRLKFELNSAAKKISGAESGSLSTIKGNVENTKKRVLRNRF